MSACRQAFIRIRRCGHLPATLASTQRTHARVELHKAPPARQRRHAHHRAENNTQSDGHAASEHISRADLQKHPPEQPAGTISYQCGVNTKVWGLLGRASGCCQLFRLPKDDTLELPPHRSSKCHICCCAVAVDTTGIGFVPLWTNVHVACWICTQELN